MTDNIVTSRTPETIVFKNPIAERFFNFYNSMQEAYLKTGEVPSSIVHEVIGSAPKIPDTPDTDAFLDAYEELAQYSILFRNIEIKVEGSSKKGA